MCKTLVLLVFSRTGSIGKLRQPRIACAEALTAVEPARDGRLLRKSCDLAALAQNRDRRLSGFPYYAGGNTLCIGVRTVGDFDATQSLLAWTD